MVEIKAGIIISGIIGLTLITLCMIIFDHIDNTIIAAIVGAIALAIGVVIPVPTINDKTGVLKW